MRKILLLLAAVAALSVLAVPVKATTTETYRHAAGNHVFTIAGKEFSIPDSFDFATAQSSARDIAARVRNGKPLGSTTAPPVALPFQPATPPAVVFYPRQDCPNGTCPYRKGN